LLVQILLFLDHQSVSIINPLDPEPADINFMSPFWNLNNLIMNDESEILNFNEVADISKKFIVAYKTRLQQSLKNTSQALHEV